MTETLNVALGDRAYDIKIGPGLLAQAGALALPHLQQKRVFVLTDENVAALHLEALREGFGAAGVAVEALALPAGEKTKGWPGLERAVEWLIEQRVERSDIVVAFGGGVIGDLAGFAAAVLRRGVDFIQIPTSLLAQVDSSVGGKTGINSVLGKNLIGACAKLPKVMASALKLSAPGNLSDRIFRTSIISWPWILPIFGISYPSKMVRKTKAQTSP